MIRIRATPGSWELTEPFETARDCMTRLPVLFVELEDGQGRRGRAEAAGVDYDGETPASMAAQLGALGPELPDDVTGADLLRRLPAGGARNALDCALWDLRARQSGVPAYRSAGLEALRCVTTVYTIGLGTHEEIRRRARGARGFPLIKLKVDATRHLDLVRIVREEHPAARLTVDANQGWDRPLLEHLLPELRANAVELIEQPLPRGRDAGLDGLACDIPLAADESCTDAASLAGLRGRYQYVNVKLDKCGGLTEALRMCHEAAALGLRLMVGNMCGSSLAMAPAFLVAQYCEYVDLDGPLLQKEDVEPRFRFEGGTMLPPGPGLWG